MTKIGSRKIRKGTYYKFFIAAFDKNGKQIAVSKTIHVAAAGGRAGNYKAVKVINVKNGTVTLKKGRTFKLKAKAVKPSKKLTVKVHRSMACESSSTKVAAVSKTGKITAKQKAHVTSMLMRRAASMPE